MSTVLSYADADLEQLVGLDVDGCFCVPLVDERGEYTGEAIDPVTLNAVRLLVPSRPDMSWLKDHPRGRTVYVGDIKTGEHPIPGGPLSLQFVAPGFALADRYGAEWIRTGIWWAREGRWEWGPPIAVDSELAVELWQRIRTAATQPPTPVVGAHCTGCFQRQHCPAFMLPASQAEDKLAAFTVPGALTPDRFVEAHMVLSALDKLVSTAKDTLKAAMREHGQPVDAGGGKVLALDTRGGREYADVGALKAAGLNQYVKRSKPSEVVSVRKR